jgi:hypothetical protein
MSVKRLALIGLAVLMWVVVVLLSDSPSHQITAQDRPTTIDRLALFGTREELAFYNVDADGQFTLLTTLEDISIYEQDNPLGRGYWEIYLPNEIKLSPDGRYIAFTAVSSRIFSYGLFIYDVSQNTLRHYEAPGIGSIHWSPDSSALLLSYPSTRTDYGLIVNDVYRFTLATSQFTRLTATDMSHPSDIQWLNSDDFIYLLFFEPNLYRMNRDGERFQLVDIPELNLPNSVELSRLFLRAVTWEPALQRLYVMISTSGVENGDIHRLYSLDRFGSSRLELDFNALYPYATGAWVVNAYVQSSRDVIVLVNGSTPDAWAEYDDYWQVYRLTSSGERNLIKTEITSDDSGSFDTIASDLSPNERFLAISEWRDYQETAIVILDLLTGQTTTFNMPMKACHIKWLDNRFLQLALDPNCVQPHFPDDGSWLLDAVTGDIQQITGGLDGYVWVLPQPDIAPNNFSPYADAGPDQTAFLEMPIHLDASQSIDTDGQIVTYQWRRDGVIIAEGINPTVFLPDGQHSLTLTVIDDDGAIGRDQVRIYVR